MQPVCLANSAFLRPILLAIQKFPATFLNLQSKKEHEIHIKNLREVVRNCFRYNDTDGIGELFPKNDSRNTALKQLIRENNKISGAFIATLGNSFPIFLVPKNADILNSIPQHQTIRIYWDNNGWYLISQEGRRIFSFDIPKQLFEMYANNGLLSRYAALNLKEEYMSTIQAFRVDSGRLQVINFKLDRSWMHQIRNAQF